MPRPFLTAEWRYLVMLNYDVEAELLKPYLPAGTTLDLWKGRAMASVVGFRFLRTRVLGLAIPFHTDFTEVNLRFYVRREMPGSEARRGVTFIRELVPRRAIALAAQWMYNEPYVALPMRSTEPSDSADSPGRIAYEWRLNGRWQHVAATPVGAAAIPSADSQEAFISEHYWGYTRQRDGSTIEYSVAHPKWRVWAARDPELDVDAGQLYGSRFSGAFGQIPVSAFVAEGSPVEVARPAPLLPR